MSAGVATEEKPRMKWTQDQALLRASEQQRQLSFCKSLNLSFRATTTSKATETKITYKLLLRERDQIWRDYVRYQFAFVEREQKRLLAGLHREMEALQRRCSELTLELANSLVTTETLAAAAAVSENNSAENDGHESQLSSITELREQLESAVKELGNMHRINLTNDHRIAGMKERYEDQEKRFKEVSDRCDRRVKEIATQLNQKSSVITQLMTQLHHLRLRQAVEQQKRQLSDQQTKRRSHSWINRGASSLDDTELGGGGSSEYLYRNNNNSNNAIDQTANRRRRSSILPPIFASTTTTLPSAAENIEKPAEANSISRSKSFRLSFRNSIARL